MMLKKNFLLLLIIGLPWVSYAQNDITAVLKTLEEVNNKYRQNDDFILNLTFRMNNTTTGAEIDKIAGIYKKKGERIYYKLGPLETGYEEKMNIVIDPFEKTVILGKGALFQPINLGDINQSILDQTISKTVVKEINSQSTQITLDLKESDISKVVVTYNPQTMLLTQVESFYRKHFTSGNTSVPVKITVTYSSFKTNAGLSKNDFLLAKCVVLNNGSYTLKPAYAGHKLYNTVSKPGSL